MSLRCINVLKKRQKTVYAVNQRLTLTDKQRTDIVFNVAGLSGHVDVTSYSKIRAKKSGIR